MSVGCFFFSFWRASFVFLYFSSQNSYMYTPRIYFRRPGKAELMFIFEFTEFPRNRGFLFLRALYCQPSPSYSAKTRDRDRKNTRNTWIRNWVECNKAYARKGADEELVSLFRVAMEVAITARSGPLFCALKVLHKRRVPSDRGGICDLLARAFFLLLSVFDF